MQRSIWAVLGTAILIAGAAIYAQTHAQTHVKNPMSPGVSSIPSKTAP